MKSYWNRVVPKSNNFIISDLIRRERFEDTEETQGRKHVMREAESGVMLPQPKEYQGSRSKEESPPRDFTGNTVLQVP